MKKFVMPESPAAQKEMFGEMHRRVQEAIQTIPATQERLGRAIAQAHEAKNIPKVRELSQKMGELRRQELCLYDQRKRLEERITCLEKDQIGSLIETPALAE